MVSIDEDVYSPHREMTYRKSYMGFLKNPLLNP